MVTVENALCLEFVCSDYHRSSNWEFRIGNSRWEFALQIRTCSSASHKADAIVDRDWIRALYEPDVDAEAALHHARFHPAPALKKS